jgi:hypothetical protein
MKSRKKPDADRPPCLTDNCWELSRVMGYCLACYAGWRRLRGYSFREFSAYHQRMRRLAARVSIIEKTRSVRHLRQAS